MEFRDYYKILGVDADASEKEIKSAYRKLARKYHPDVSDESDAEEQFKGVVEAYEVLKDQDKRAEYDTLRQYGGERFEPPPGWQSAASGAAGGEYEGGFSDFFENIFGQAGHGSRQGFSRQQFAQRGEDIEMGLSIFLEEAYRGETRTITYRVPSFDEQGQFSRKTRTLNVKIPAGVTSGERIRLQGQGAPGIGEAPPGDLYLEIRIADHPLYEEEGVNLSLTLPISPWEAALGCKVTVPTLDGKINLSVPAASQNGVRLRVKGKGLGKAGTRGDLFVVLAISMPQSMDSEETVLWRQLSEKSSYNPRENWVSNMTDTSYYLTLTEVTRSIRMPEQTVITIVDHGIVEPRGRQPSDWRFDPPMLITIRKACRLQHDLELDWPGTALALELIGRVQQLREENRRLRRQLDRLTG